jgi:hypothetical protein
MRGVRQALQESKRAEVPSRSCTTLQPRVEDQPTCKSPRAQRECCRCGYDGHGYFDVLGIRFRSSSYSLLRFRNSRHILPSSFLSSGSLAFFGIDSGLANLERISSDIPVLVHKSSSFTASYPPAFGLALAGVDFFPSATAIGWILRYVANCITALHVHLLRCIFFDRPFGWYDDLMCIERCFKRLCFVFLCAIHALAVSLRLISTQGYYPSPNVCFLCADFGG